MKSLVLKTALANDALLENLTEHERNLLLQQAVLKEVDRGTVLYRKGDDLDGLIRLISGKVRIGAATASGNEFILTTLGAGDWFGEISIFDNQPRSHDATTLEPCRYASFSASKIKPLCDQYSAINKVMIGLLCSHMRAAFAAIDDFLLLSPEQRLIKRLLSYLRNQPNSSTVKLSQQELSDLIGLSRQSISKILRSWEQVGLIQRVYGGLKILDAERLELRLPHT